MNIFIDLLFCEPRIMQLMITRLQLLIRTQHVGCEIGRKCYMLTYKKIKQDIFR